MKGVVRMVLIVLVAQAAPVVAHARAIWGVTGGVVGARMYGDYGDLFDEYRAGGAAGAHVRVPLRSGVSFQPELYWILKGGHADVDFVTSAGTFSLTVDHSIPYLELPLLVRFELPASTMIQPFVILGPTFSLRVGGHAETEPFTGLTARAPGPPVRFASIFASVGDPWQTDYRNADAGVMGGAGIVVGRGSVRASAELRYERGFVDVVSSDFGDGSKSGVIGGFFGFEVH